MKTCLEHVRNTFIKIYRPTASQSLQRQALVSSQALAHEREQIELQRARLELERERFEFEKEKYAFEQQKRGELQEET